MTDTHEWDNDKARIAGWKIICVVIIVSIMAGVALKYDVEHSPKMAWIEGR